MAIIYYFYLILYDHRRSITDLEGMLLSVLLDEWILQRRSVSIQQAKSINQIWLKRPKLDKNHWLIGTGNIVKSIIA